MATYVEAMSAAATRRRRTDDGESRGGTQRARRFLIKLPGRAESRGVNRARERLRTQQVPGWAARAQHNFILNRRDEYTG